MKIIKGKEYRIKGKSTYFLNKYGTSNPIIRIEDEHEKLLHDWWGNMEGNPACMLYSVRVAMMNIPMDSPGSKEVYGGKIDNLSELVHESELEEIKV